MSELKRITLYASIDSPFPHRVRLALEEANVEHNIIWIDLLNKPEWYGKKVYQDGARVPYLVYGGPKLHADESPSPEAAQIPESITILEFLADIFPNSHLLPADPVLRAKARLFYQTVDTAFIPAFVGFFFSSGEMETLLSPLERLQGMLPPTGYAVGEWSIADAALTPLLVRLMLLLRLNPVTVKKEVLEKTTEALHSPRFARIQQYLKDNSERPSMAKTFDEAANTEYFFRRMDRITKTGVVNADLRVPIPQAQQ